MMNSLEMIVGSVVAPSSFRLVVAETNRWYWVATQPGVAWYLALNKRLVDHRTVVAMVAAYTKMAVLAVAEGIAASAAVDRDN